MVAAAAQKGVVPGAPDVGESATVLLPRIPDLFLARARRLRRLAEGHSLGAFLGFVASLSEAQERVLDCPAARDALALPSLETQALARTHRMPLIPTQPGIRKGAWRIVLFEILEAVRCNVPAETAAVVDTLFNANSVELEALAEAALGNQWQHPQRAALPLVSAALQAVWTRAAAQLDATGVEHLDMANLCPLCGSLPVSSVIRAGGAEAGLRYLHCSLCNCEWHMVRAQCSMCGKSDAHAYLGIEGGPRAVLAETCDACHGYLKLLRMDRDPEVDPVADDLASLALDLLADERGYARGGPNPMLIPGPD